MPVNLTEVDNSLAKWHVVYFVKQGLYQGAILKFQIEFPISYPNQRPKATFLNPRHIFHPLVHSKTGEINLDFDFGGPQGWQPGKHWAITVLLSIKKMLHLEPYYTLDGKTQMAFNKDALSSFTTSFEDDFVEKCKACV